MAAAGAVSTSGTGEVAGSREGMAELVMFTVAVVFASPNGSVGAVNVYDDKPILVEDDAPVVDVTVLKVCPVGGGGQTKR